MIRKYRILHIILQSGFGGMEKRVARLANGLDPNLFSISILTFRPAQGQSIEFPSHVEYTEFPISSGLHFTRFLELSAWIKKGKFDTVHTHNWSTMFYGILAGRWAKVPILLHGEHGLNLQDLAGTSLKRKLIQAVLARIATRIVPVNSVIADHVQKVWKISEGKMITINNGVDLDRFSPVYKKSSEFILGTVARFDAVKDIGCQIRAMAILNRTVPESRIKLWIVGDGPEKSSLVELTESLQIAGHVKFVAATPKVEDCYGQFSIYLNSSKYEGMSNTILEAMACGLPVVCTAVSGNQVWLNPDVNTLFFEPGNAEQLAAHIRELYENNEKRESMGRVNRERVEKDFNNQVFLEKYKALYLELMNDSK